MTAENFKPDYIPPHLEGRVSDFRRELDGSVSFFDPRAALGTFGPEKSRTTVTPEVYDSTFGKDRFDLARSAETAYGVPRQSPTLTSMAHDWIVDKGRRGLNYGLSSEGRAAGTVGLLSALAGGLAGGVGENGSLGRGLLYALLAGGAGVGATALSQNLHKNREANRTKAASVTKSAFADTDLLSLLATNTFIPENDKRMFIAAFARLQAREKDELARLLRVTAGATAGAMIARYLRGKGLLPMVVGGMLGAFVGRALSPRPIFNNLGQLSVLNLQ